MTTSSKEESELALADRHIAEAHQRIARQDKRVHEQLHGLDLSQSEKLLYVMQEIVCSF